MIRKAVISDVPRMQELLNSYARQGKLLPRSLNQIYEGLRDFAVYEEDGAVVGCGALHVLWSDLAEIRSLAVDEACKGRGYGRDLVGFLLEEARQLGVPRVFTLTFAKNFFRKMGFSVLDKNELPRKIWAVCVDCIHFPDCQEVALDIYLEGDQG